MDVEWIREGLDRAGKTQRGLAKALGVEPPQISRLLAGTRRLKADEIVKIADYLEVTPPAFGSFSAQSASAQPPSLHEGSDRYSAAHPGDPPNAPPTLREEPLRPNAVLPPGGIPDRSPDTSPFLRDLPVRGVAQGGPDGVLNIDQEHPIDWTWRPPELAGVREAYAVFIDGDSMSSTGMTHGSTAWVHPNRRPGPGNFVVLVKKTGEAYVKRYVKITQTHVIIEQTDPPKRFNIARADVQGLHYVVGSIYR